MPKGQFVRTEEHKRNIALAKLGKKRSLEECAAISAGKKAAGYVMSEEDKEFRRKWIKDNPVRVGIVVTEETRQKLRDAKANRAPALLYKYGVTDEQYMREMAAGNKWCFVKKHFHPKDDFSSSAKCCNGCKATHHRNINMADFGLTQDNYIAKLEAQGSACAICGLKKTDDIKRNFHVDHDHKNNQIRGILCMRCNHTIERLDTVDDWALKAMSYLAKYKLVLASGKAEFAVRKPSRIYKKSVPDSNEYQTTDLSGALP